MSTTRIRYWLREAQRRIDAALGPELRIIAAELKERVNTSPDEGEVEQRIDAERIDALLDGVLPEDADRTTHQSRALFRHALATELSLPTRQNDSVPASIVLVTGR